MKRHKPRTSAEVFAEIDRDLRLPIQPDLRGRLNADGTITPCADMSWLGAPPTARQAAEYETRRAAILASNLQEDPS